MKLEGKIDEIIDLLIDGKTYRQIAESYNVSISTLHYFLSLPEHHARAKTALSISADQYADKAEETLINAKATKEELMRARELAQHYRWKAAKRDPSRYGDKLAVEQSGTVRNINLNTNLTPEDIKTISDALEKDF